MFINDLFFKVREIIEVSPAKRDRLILISLIVSGILNLAAWALIPIFFWHIKEFVVLQYNIYFGISSLGPWPMLFLMPASGLLVAAVNYSLSFYFFLKEKALSLFLASAALSYQLIILAALCLIIYMNL
jgi:hypothetical protein